MNCSKGILWAAAAGVVLLTATGVEAASLADAKAQIAAGLESSAKMEQIVKGLAAADQTAFVAAVNTAIDSLPGKASAKAKTYATANQAMLKGAEKKNLSAMVAEVFATVPVEAQPELAKAFAENLFDRGASKVDDATFSKIAESVTKDVVARAAKADDGDVRAAFAIVMFDKASKGAPAGLTDSLVKLLPADAQAKAASQWIPAAKKGDYGPILAAADTTVEPAKDEKASADDEDAQALKDALVLRASPAQILDLIAAERAGVKAFSAVNNPSVYAQPLDGLDNTVPMPVPVEPQGYGNQW